MSNRRDDETRRRGGSTSPWEWVVAAVGGILVLGAAGFMLWEALHDRATPPSLEVGVEAIHRSEAGYLVEFRIENRGRRTAAAVLVEGELQGDTGIVERAEATIDYVPAQASGRGGLFFTKDPSVFTLRLRPKGYSRP